MNKLESLFNRLFRNNATDIYARKSRWKWYLAVIGMAIIVFTTVYTNYLVGKIRQQEVKRIENYRKAQNLYVSLPLEIVNDPEIGTFISSFTMDSTLEIPMILTDERFNIQDIKGYKDEIDQTGYLPERDSVFATEKLNEFIRAKKDPLLVRDGIDQIIQKIYFDDSNILTLLRYYPLVQFILIALFIAFGYLGFSASRRNEQNRVWVGMAKETAHQLGTPIAAIMGWIEHLRSSHEEDEMTQEVVNELENDVNRLSLVADRFSKIGSEPELETTNIYEALDRCRTYMQKRAPRKVVFDFPTFAQPDPMSPDEDNPYLGVKLNNHLFDWVVENLMRNALDAMEDGKGTISAQIHDEGAFVSIDISDTGKGIPANKFKTVFQPGFTTKKRGWGLGLSLAKRIIENYHGGKIFVKDSLVGKYTTFSIRLPKAK